MANGVENYKLGVSELVDVEVFDVLQAHSPGNPPCSILSFHSHMHHRQLVFRLPQLEPARRQIDRC